MAASTSTNAQAPSTINDLPPAVVLRPVFAQHKQILDVVPVNASALLVLDRDGVTRYERDNNTAAEPLPRWRALESVQLPARAWPRDLRGRLVVDKGRVAVMLPGVACSVAFGPPGLACRSDRTPWPLPLVSNDGLEPGRNYVTTPEGFAFYGGASLDGAGGPGALVADRQGRLVRIGAGGRVLADFGEADDVIAVRARCAGPARYFVAAVRRPDSDVLRPFVFANDQLTQALPDFVLPGQFMSVSVVDDRAFVITRTPGGDRYDAFEASISCR